ncbi:MAG: hypothetical protein ACK6AD_03680 [Cyanobacteriota bacterium]|jgi:hypothetical protein
MALLPFLLGLTLLDGALRLEPFRAPVIGGVGPIPVGIDSVGVGRPGSAALAMSSPWWEDYDVKERYLCTEKGGVVLERNASQAALISGGSITTLFREASEGPALVYRNDDLRLILRGDELTVERLPMKITCVRSEQV